MDDPRRRRRVAARVAVVFAVLLFSVTIVDVVPAIAGVLADIGLISDEPAATTAADAREGGAANPDAPSTGATMLAVIGTEPGVDEAAMARLVEFVAEQPELLSSWSPESTIGDGETVGDGLSDGLGTGMGPLGFLGATADSTSAAFTAHFGGPDAGSWSGGLISEGTDEPTPAASEPARAATAVLSLFDSGSLSQSAGTVSGVSAVLAANMPELGVLGTDLTGASELSLSTLGTSSTSPQMSVVSTPEPASLVLLGTGLIGVAAAYRRRKRVEPRQSIS